MQPGKRIFIRTYTTQADKLKRLQEVYDKMPFDIDEKVLIVEIEDMGAGIPADVLVRIYDPFFTTKEPGEGAGLGLSVTKSIIDMHKGFMDIESEVGKGTKITVILKVK